MDFEAVQLLNLSPIPELSEFELSTMLEQLSGLSDLNGELTDRNVEDILKEAENLIDTSMCSKITELPNTEMVASDEPMQQANEEPEKINEVQESLSDAIINNSPIENITVKCSPKKVYDVHYNSPAEQSEKIFSPAECSNPIKSTIDSLKEFSTLVERQLSSRSSGSVRENHEENSNKSVEREKSPKPILKNSKEVIGDTGNSESAKMSKATRLLNCFERLYQDRPNRLKAAERIAKNVIKKKVVSKSPVKPGKTPPNRSSNSEEVKDKINNKYDNLPKHYLEVENWLRDGNMKCTIQNNYKLDIPPRRMEEESENDSMLYNQRGDCRIDECSRVSSQIDEKLILKLLQGMEEIKDHVKRTGVKNEVPERMIQESQAVIDNLKSEVESVRERVASETMKNAGIERLEEQFAILKDKYDQHMKKLEAENLKLREALSRNTKVPNIEFPRRVEPNTGERKIIRSFSLDSCTAPKNSPGHSTCSSFDDNRSSKQKEAFSQTDKELRSMSIQCLEDPKFEEVTIEEEEESVKIENKENLTGRKKLIKDRPFSEKNVQQLLKQKKFTSEHETQLLATLRGLQAEINMKEKENRKLKTEIDLLKNQVKRTGKVVGKVESSKRRHIGTQTIALGQAAQKPYNPELFEVPRVFEKENEELKTKIKALEEDFEMLKEKRITDLQALHQVHEEEMAKLLSKLETQSALTKHLHSLLVNR